MFDQQEMSEFAHVSRASQREASLKVCHMPHFGRRAFGDFALNAAN